MSQVPQLSDVANYEEHWFNSVLSNRQASSLKTPMEQANFALRYVETPKQMEFVLSKIPDGKIDVTAASVLVNSLISYRAGGDASAQKNDTKLLAIILGLMGQQLADLSMSNERMFLPSVVTDPKQLSVLTKMPIDWSVYHRGSQKGPLLMLDVGNYQRWDSIEKFLKHPHMFQKNKEAVLLGWTASILSFIDGIQKRRFRMSPGSLHSSATKAAQLLTKILACSDHPTAIQEKIKNELSKSVIMSCVNDDGVFSVSPQTSPAGPKSLKNIPEQKLVDKARKSVRDVQELVSRNISLDRLTSRRTTFLEDAIENKNVAVVKELLKHGASVDMLTQRKFGNSKISILQYACAGLSSEIVELLIDHGAPLESVSRPDRHTALHFACNRGKIDILTVLKNKGANMNALTKTKNNALFELGNLREPHFFETVKFLVLAGVDPFHKNALGQTFDEFLKAQVVQWGGASVGEQAALDALNDYLKTISAYQINKSLSESSIAPSAPTSRRRM